MKNVAFENSRPSSLPARVAFLWERRRTTVFAGYEKCYANTNCRTVFSRHRGILFQFSKTAQKNFAGAEGERKKEKQVAHLRRPANMPKLTSRIKKGVEYNSEEIDVKVKPFFCNLIYFPIYKVLETVRENKLLRKMLCTSFLVFFIFHGQYFTSM